MSSLVSSIAASISADDHATLSEASLDMMYTDGSVSLQNAYSNKLSSLQDSYQIESADISDPSQPYILAKDWSNIQDTENEESQANSIFSANVSLANSVLQGLSKDEASEYQADGSLGSFCTFMQNIIGNNQG